MLKNIFYLALLTRGAFISFWDCIRQLRILCQQLTCILLLYWVFHNQNIWKIWNISRHLLDMSSTVPFQVYHMSHILIWILLAQIVLAENLCCNREIGVIPDHLTKKKLSAFPGHNVEKTSWTTFHSWPSFMTQSWMDITILIFIFFSATIAVELEIHFLSQHIFFT